MKKTTTFLCLLLAGIGFNTATAQLPTSLYAGQKNSSNLTEIDTTGGGFTVLGTVSCTSDFGPVNDIMGLALDPDTEELYVLYESGAGESNRRLGTVDPMSGSITDIGGTGYYHNDIEFGPDGTLYASSSSWSPGTYQFREIDKVTAASSFLFNYAASQNETGICYNPFADEMIKMGGSGISSIDLGTMSETTETFSGTHPFRICASVVYSANKAIIANNANIYTFDPVTNEFTYMASSGGSWYHAFSFGPTPCSPIDITVSTDSICEGEMVTLSATSLTGGTITWDGGVVDGLAFDPGLVGTYYYTPTSDSDADCVFDSPPVTIAVIGNPTVVGGAGDGHFCDGETVTLTAGGDAHILEWNDGDDLDLNPAVGTHTYTLTGYYTGACEAETTIEVEIEMHALPTISGSADASPICIGNEVTLTGAGGETYWWSMDVENGVAFTPNTIGTTTYTVIGWDEFGCENTADVAVEVVEGITIATTSITLETVGSDGAIDIEISGGAPTYTFDWDNDGTGDFDDSEDLTGLTAGFYTVVVKGDAGCESTRTYELDSQLGIDDLENVSIQVYPNPTSDIVNIELEGTFNYELIAINGDVIYVGSATDKKVISLKNLADGVYFVNVNSENNSTTVKLIKK